MLKHNFITVSGKSVFETISGLSNNPMRSENCNSCDFAYFLFLLFYFCIYTWKCFGFFSHSVLYGNKIKNLPTNVFRGLTSLQLLLLNANEISCIRKDSFKDLTSLSLLSLYDNNIQSLANGTFESMKSIQTL